VGCGGILLTTLFLALYSPPNAPDALSYHLPRVERWALDRAIGFYPTDEQRQLWIAPGAEYFLVQLRVLAGTGRVYNLLQWLAFALCPIVLSLIARELGASRRGQLFSAVYSLTIPMAISQASGSQVDIVASFWLCVSVALMLRVKLKRANTSVLDAAALGAACGLAYLAKGTNAMFLFPFVVWTLASLMRQAKARMLPLAAVSLIVVAAVIAPHTARTCAQYGNPFGPETTVKLTNDVISPAALASNVIRNAALHASAPADAWNRALFAGILRVHKMLGVDVNDPRTTWTDLAFSVPRKREDEHVSGNPLHALLILLATIVAARSRKRAAFAALACTIAGALIFALLLKWQPWHSRMHLPLFVVAGGAAGATIGTFSARRTAWIACALLIGSSAPLMRNMLRPLVARQTVFSMPYEKVMLADLPAEHTNYRAAADFVASRKCARVGLLNSKGGLEYPVWQMLGARLHAPVEIRPVQVSNPTRRLASQADRAFRPCAVISIFRINPESWNPPPPGFYFAWRSGSVAVYVMRPHANI
jgi:hypothetical protein